MRQDIHRLSFMWPTFKLPSLTHYKHTNNSVPLSIGQPTRLPPLYQNFIFPFRPSSTLLFRCNILQVLQ